LQLLVLAFTLLPFMFSTREWVAANLRWQFRNKEYGNLMNLNSILNAILAVLGAKFLGVYGVILGINLSYAATITLGLFYLRKDIKAIFSSSKLNKKMQSSFDRYSLTMCLTNVLISILFTIDLFVIGNIVKNPEQIANYKAACVIPFALNMIPNAVMTFLFPYFSKNKENKDWLKRNIKKLYIANGITNGIIGLCLIILAPLLIRIIFGKQYLEIVTPFRLLTVSYIVSASLRTPSANLLAMLKKTKMALCISAVSVALCVIMDIFLVSSFGIIGAAYSSVIAFSIIGIVSCSMIMLLIYKRQPVTTKC
jgi:O-antigen/teichoic acid export membrane protein